MRSLAEYHEAIESFAREVYDRTKEGEDESDVLHEVVDSADWIIYTAHALAVLEHTRNDDAVFDEMGKEALDGCDSTAAVYARIAFYAFRADISAYLADQRDEWDKETPAE